MAITTLRDAMRHRRRSRSPGCFVREDDGNTALEFALIAPVFFSVIFAIFEVAMIFGSNVLLENAATKAARAVRTGQVYTASLPDLQESAQKTLFETAMCQELILIDCDSLTYDVRVFTTFAAANAVMTCDSNGDLETTNFDIGEPADIVVLTVMYPYRQIIPNPLVHAGRDWKTEAEGGCNGLSMRSVIVFRNEPFPKG